VATNRADIARPPHGQVPVVLCELKVRLASIGRGLVVVDGKPASGVQVKPIRASSLVHLMKIGFVS
jgi:hypothetical protein